MENNKPMYAFCQEVKATANGEDRYYFTERNGEYVVGSLSYDKQKAWEFYVCLSNEGEKDIVKTILHTSDEKK